MARTAIRHILNVVSRRFEWEGGNVNIHSIEDDKLNLVLHDGTLPSVRQLRNPENATNEDGGVCNSYSSHE